MNTRTTPFIAAGLLGLATAAFAEPPTGSATIEHLATTAEQQLASSVKDLNQLREQIAAEKLPLAQELTSLEERLTQLRKDYDAALRRVDEGNLLILNTKTEIKARQDELTYVGTLLDEYARTFESKVNISELQYCGESVEAAKQATENTTLSLTEKFTRQVDFVNVSVKRLFDTIGGMSFAGVGVDTEGTLVNGQFAIIGPVALFREQSGATAGIAVPQSGSTKPLIRPLEGEMQAGLVSLMANGDGFIPLDPSRGGALKALVQKTNIYHLFEKGGPIMWPLLAASVLALGTVIERFFFLIITRFKRSTKALEKFFMLVAKGDLAGAIQVGRSSRFYVVRALGYALSHRETSLQSAILFAQAHELKRFQRGIPILDTVITLAPLLGLLGTVTGMMGSFKIIGGDLSSPGAITGGIAEALIATAFGLGIAITALLPFNFLNTKMEQARQEIDAAATQLELLVHPQSATMNNDARKPAPGPAVEKNHDLHAQRVAIQRQIDQLQAELQGHNSKPATSTALEPVAKE